MRQVSPTDTQPPAPHPLPVALRCVCCPSSLPLPLPLRGWEADLCRAMDAAAAAYEPL